MHKWAHGSKGGSLIKLGGACTLTGEKGCGVGDGEEHLGVYCSLLVAVVSEANSLRCLRVWGPKPMHWTPVLQPWRSRREYARADAREYAGG